MRRKRLCGAPTIAKTITRRPRRARNWSCAAKRRSLVQTWEETCQQARAECEPLPHLLPRDVTMKRVNRQQPEVQKAAKTLELQARQARRAWEDAFKAVGDHTAKLAGCD